MSCSLPPEIFDLIVDHLYNERTTLESCCVASKSWVLWTRNHLFAHIRFDALRPIKSWMQVFPDPSNSLSHHARTLHLCEQVVPTLTDPDVGRWIRTFHRVENLYMDIFGRDYYGVSFVQLHGFSPTLKSLTLVYTSVSLKEVFNLICSFPLLEDLGFIRYAPTGPIIDEWNPPPASPKLTGSLRINGGLRSIVRRLCDLPGGLHFSKISVFHNNDEGPTLATDLVSKCSDTLESFTISHCAPDASGIPSLDLSEATKLKDVELHYCMSTRWVITMFRTAKSENLQRITVILSTATVTQIEEEVYREWQDLDHLLLQLWTSRSIRPKVVHKRGRRKGGMRDVASRLLPELAKRGVVEVVE